jgi:Tol biopolymer transport system component
VAAALALRTAIGRPAVVAPDAGARAPRISAITAEGTVRMASLSPDGAEVAYVCMNGTQESLWLRQVGATTALQLVGPADGTFRSVSFGPGGFVYYTFFSPDRSNVPLYRVSTHGGEPAVVSNAAGGVSFSPDGTQYAYVSSFSMGLRESRVIVEDVNGGAPRVLAVRTPPASYSRTRPAWSPDGRRLAVVAMDDRRPLAPELVAIDVRDARERPIATLDVEVIDAVLWPRDTGGARLIVSARERGAQPLRLWDVSVATGGRRPVTDDASDYLLTGLARDGQRAVAVRTSTAWSLWVAPLVDAAAAAREVARGVGAFDLLEGVAWTSAGQLVYAAVESGNLDLWRLDPDTGARARLTSDPAEDFHPAVSPDGRTVVFASTRSGTSAIWATPIDDERPRRLSAGGDRWPSWAPDGRWVVFQRGLADTAIEAVWRVPVDGGDAERIGPPHSYRPVVSPDARSVAHYWMNPEQWALAVTRIGSALPARALPIARTHGNRVVRWSPDGSALAFIDGVGGVANIWLQPIDGGPARRLTDFPNGTIATFDWSRDGSRLAWIRVRHTGDVVGVELAR